MFISSSWAFVTEQSSCRLWSAGTWSWCSSADSSCVWLWIWERKCHHLQTSSWLTRDSGHFVWAVGHFSWFLMTWCKSQLEFPDRLLLFQQTLLEDAGQASLMGAAAHSHPKKLFLPGHIKGIIFPQKTNQLFKSFIKLVCSSHKPVVWLTWMFFIFEWSTLNLNILNWTIGMFGIRIMSFIFCG